VSFRMSRQDTLTKDPLRWDCLNPAYWTMIFSCKKWLDMVIKRIQICTTSYLSMRATYRKECSWFQDQVILQRWFPAWTAARHVICIWCIIVHRKMIMSGGRTWIQRFLFFMLHQFYGFIILKFVLIRSYDFTGTAHPRLAAWGGSG